MPVELTGGAAPPKAKPAAPPPPPAPAPPAPTVPYNPQGYVPGGSSDEVGQAIEAQAIVTPGPTPVQVPADIEKAIPPDTPVFTESGEPSTFGAEMVAGPPAPSQSGGAAPSLPQRYYTHVTLKTLWIAAGGDADDADVAQAVALAESGGDALALNNTAYPDLPEYHPPAKGNQREYSVGLWQINILAHTRYTEPQMDVPIENARAAVALRNANGDFSPWSTYNNGAYEKFLTGETPDVYVAPPPPPKPRPAGAGSAWARVIDVYDVAVPRERDRVQSFGASLLSTFK